MIDYIDSYRNVEGEDEHDGVKLQYRLVGEEAFSSDLDGNGFVDEITQITAFDFDYQNSFEEKGIDIDADFSAGSTSRLAKQFPTY